MSREPAGWDVDSPIQAEVFVVWLDGDRLQLTGPDGPQAWLLQLGPTEHPVEVVDRIVRDVVGPPMLVHSTSWRRDRDAVILSFVVVIPPELVRSMASVPIASCAIASMRSVSLLRSARRRIQNAPSASPRMNAESINSNECVALPWTSDSMRIQAIS